ncbi:MAG: queuosine precursor transporter [Janthinobacterium lividum]
MTNSEKIYIGLCIIFSTLIILGNLIYQKFVMLQIPFYKFELSAGAILYPLTFLITDIITELYGKEKANFCIRLAICMNVLVTIIIMFVSYLPATDWSKVNDETFNKVFSYYSVAFLASIIACYIAQAIDVNLYLWIRKLTKGKYLWLRSNVSTCISLFIDTTIVISFMAMFSIFPVEQIWKLIINSYSWKLFFTICCTPLVYLSLFSIGGFIKAVGHPVASMSFPRRRESSVKREKSSF